MAIPLQFSIGPEIAPIYNPSYLNLPTAISHGTAQAIMLQGRNPNPVTSGWCDIWGFPGTTIGASQAIRNVNTAGYTLAVVSDSASDTSAGTGAQTVTIQYLDTSYNPWLATFALNGVTAVTVPTSIVNPFNPTQTLPAAAITNCFRINASDVATVGTGGLNVGNIYVFDNSSTVTAGVPQTPAKVYDVILPGDNTDMTAAVTVPAGYYGMLVQVMTNLATIAATTLMGKTRAQYTQGNNGLWKAINLGSVCSAGDGTSNLDPVFSPIFQPMSDVRPQGVASSATSSELQILAGLILWPSTQ